jgi:enoyl-CoA hydratase/3-hydroxyacyl-CoA dehydrogenase
MGKIKKVTVLGAGDMGAQIALLAAEAGFDVTVRDIQEQFLERGRKSTEDSLDRRIKRGRLTEEAKKELLGKLHFTLDLKEAVSKADYVIEAVTESLDVKHKLFKEVYDLAPKHTIFGTNTSSFMIGDVAETVPEPERVIGVHFFNPPSALTLLEIIYGEKTGQKAKKVTDELAKALGRQVIYCRKDSPGFVTTRLFVIFLNEAIWALEEGATAEEIDAAVRYRLGYPMGALELMDTLGGGGIGLQRLVSDYLRSKLGESYRPPTILEKLNQDKHLGKRFGKGFYDWSEGKTNEIQFKLARRFNPIRIFAPMINEAAKLLEAEVATKEEIDMAMMLGLGYPRGPLRIADSMGLDRIVDELNRLFNIHKEERYRCCPMLADMVAQSKLGRKTGEGFYSYGPGKYEFISLRLNKETKVAEFILDRPQRANSLNTDFLAEMVQALDVLEADNAVRCVVFKGAGRNFCGGADLQIFSSGDIEEITESGNWSQKFFFRLETLSKPTLAAINGPALGAGLELAASCDFRIAVADAILGLPELTLGIFPGCGGTQRITRLIGLARAKELILGAQIIKPSKALEWGLINAVGSPEEFEKLVDETARRLANSAQPAYNMVKKVMYYGAQADQQTGIFLEASSFPDVTLSEAASKGITTFAYRRAR